MKKPKTIAYYQKVNRDLKKSLDFISFKVSQMIEGSDEEILKKVKDYRKVLGIVK